MATLGLSEARLAQTRVSRCPEASSALPLSPNLDSLHVLFVGGRGGPAGRSTGHTHQARHRLAAAVGSAPAREAGPFGMGESEARAAHAGDRGDRPRCRAYAQAVGCVPSVPGALTGPCAPSCPWEENRPQPLPSHEAVREEGLRKNRPLRWLLSSAEKGGASPLKQPTRVCPQVGCVVAGSLAHLVVQPTLVQGAEPGS